MHRITMMLLLGAAAIHATAGNAIAADMPESAAPSPEPSPIFYAPAPYSWSGIYIGGNFGWAWTQISDTITIPGTGTGSLTGNTHGFLGGVQAGYNWQLSQPIVIGIEADFQGAQATAAGRSVNGVAGAAIITGTANTPYFGTVRGRIGYAHGTLMFYGTAGAVYGGSTLRATVMPFGPFYSSATFASWTAGAGIEAGLGGNYSAKLEYLFIGSPSNSPLIPGAALTGSSGTSLVRAGVNYRF